MSEMITIAKWDWKPIFLAISTDEVPTPAMANII